MHFGHHTSGKAGDFMAIERDQLRGGVSAASSELRKKAPGAEERSEHSAAGPAAF